MSLKTDGTFSIISKKNISIEAENDIKIQSEKVIKITSGESILIASQKNGALEFDNEGQVKEMGTKVNNN